MADEVPAATAPVLDVPIVPETEAEQQAKQEASLSPEELDQLRAGIRENQRKQREAEAARQNLTLEGLDARLGELTSRVDALEQAASSSSSKTSSSKASTTSSKSSDSTATTSQS